MNNISRATAVLNAPEGFDYFRLFQTPQVQMKIIIKFPEDEGGWTLCSSERTEPTLVWRTYLHSTQSKTIGSREWFI